MVVNPITVQGAIWLLGALGALIIATNPATQQAAQQTGEAVAAAMDKASTKLRDAVIAEPCHNCERPECKEINRRISERINGRKMLKERYEHMLHDRSKHNLFRDHFSTSNPHPDGYGSWEGHQQKYRDLQVNLGRLIAQAESLVCPITVPDALEWATKPPPNEPL